MPGLHKRAAPAAHELRGARHAVAGGVPEEAALQVHLALHVLALGAYLDGALQLALKLGAGDPRKGLLEDDHVVDDGLLHPIRPRPQVGVARKAHAHLLGPVVLEVAGLPQHLHVRLAHQRALMGVLYGHELPPLGIGLNVQPSASFIARLFLSVGKKSGPMNARVFLVVAVAVILLFKMPRLLELFCGTKSVGRAFEAAGWEVVSLDIVLKFEPRILCDIRSWDYTTFPGHFNMVWASPVCTEYSRALTTSRAPRTTTGSGRTVSRRSSPRRPPGTGGGALASPLRLQRTTSTPTYVLSFAHVCASKTRGGSLGLRTYSMTPGATRLQTRGVLWRRCAPTLTPCCATTGGASASPPRRCESSACGATPPCAC